MAFLRPTLDATHLRKSSHIFVAVLLDTKITLRLGTA